MYFSTLGTDDKDKLILFQRGYCLIPDVYHIRH